MGNLSYLVPTKNKEDFNINKIFSLLQDKFGKDVEIRKYTGDSTGNTITIRDKKDEYAVVCDIFFENKPCYLLDEIPKNYPVNPKTILYKKLEDANLNGIVSCKVNYGHWEYRDLRRDITNFICESYECYFLDEGIFPEHFYYKNGIKYNVA